jgi:SAM-dependent methyltransferase
VVDDNASLPCPVCGGTTKPCGSTYSSFSERRFSFQRCDRCFFTFVRDPRVDFESLYDGSYYRGEGADPSVDYAYEAAHMDRTVRRFEWQGVLNVVSSLVHVGPATQWLDYGCGTGGLVTYLRTHGVHQAVGFEEGWGADVMRAQGSPPLARDDLQSRPASFDVVTLIEVIEHAVDPVAELERVHRLLRPGGLCFLTTGNAEPFRDRFSDWAYALPDVHVSYFEPDTLRAALERSGFSVTFPGYRDGWDDILRFKIMKGLHRRTSGAAAQLVPWRLVTRAVDRRLALSRHPVGWA